MTIRWAIRKPAMSISVNQSIRSCPNCCCCHLQQQRSIQAAPYLGVPTRCVHWPGACIGQVHLLGVSITPATNVMKNASDRGAVFDSVSRDGSNQNAPPCAHRHLISSKAKRNEHDTRARHRHYRCGPPSAHIQSTKHPCAVQ